MCEPAMVVAADLLRSWVMFDFGTPGGRSCKDVPVEGIYIYNTGIIQRVL